jgi:putative glutamine amidotransferase
VGTLPGVPTPLIAVPAHRVPVGRIRGWPQGAFAVPEGYVSAVKRAGGRPAALTWPDLGPIEEVLERFDGLLLLGGADVDPGRYAPQTHPAVYGVDSARDATEIALVRRAVEMGLPTMAICRGAQVVNVALGGSLLQHLPDVEGMRDHGSPVGGVPVMHSVKVQAGSHLADACAQERLDCQSHHHQGIDRLGEGLVPVGWSEDGLVEAAEHEEGWVLALQWHPEQTAGRDPAQQRLFDGFVQQARGAR